MQQPPQIGKTAPVDLRDEIRRADVLVPIPLPSAATSFRSEAIDVGEVVDETVGTN